MALNRNNRQKARSAFFGNNSGLETSKYSVRSDDSNETNGLLNYGYSLVMSEVARKIAEFGYLTEFGIHHDSEKNPFNLACDLMEPFRPFVDAKVFELREQTLNSEVKNELIRLLRTDLPEFGTCLTQLINIFVRDAFHYLSGDGRLPELGFIDEV